MASDRTKLSLIDDIKNGVLPQIVHEESAPVFETARLLQLIESATFNYNPDGSLTDLRFGDKTFKFVWNSDGSLHKINTYRNER